MFWKQQGTIVKIRILNIFIFLSNEKNATSDIDGLISSCHNIEASSFSIQLTLYTNTTLWKSATILLRVFVNQNKISENLVYLIQENICNQKTNDITLRNYWTIQIHLYTDTDMVLSILLI